MGMDEMECSADALGFMQLEERLKEDKRVCVMRCQLDGIVCVMWVLCERNICIVVMIYLRS